jgi:hypothetical protein
MWITVATVNENVNMELAGQLLLTAGIERSSILAEGVETGGNLLAPHNSFATAATDFSPGTVFKRAWNLESSARRMADFVNNYTPAIMTVVVEEQPDI